MQELEAEALAAGARLAALEASAAGERAAAEQEAAGLRGRLRDAEACLEQVEPTLNPAP